MNDVYYLYMYSMYTHVFLALKLEVIDTSMTSLATWEWKTGNFFIMIIPVSNINALEKKHYYYYKMWCVLHSNV